MESGRKCSMRQMLQAPVRERLPILIAWPLPARAIRGRADNCENIRGASKRTLSMGAAATNQSRPLRAVFSHPAVGSASTSGRSLHCSAELWRKLYKNAAARGVSVLPAYLAPRRRAGCGWRDNSQWQHTRGGGRRRGSVAWKDTGPPARISTGTTTDNLRCNSICETPLVQCLRQATPNLHHTPPDTAAKN